MKKLWIGVLGLGAYAFWAGPLRSPFFNAQAREAVPILDGAPPAPLRTQFDLTYSDMSVDIFTGAITITDVKAWPLPEWDDSRVTDPDEQIVVSHNWEELRRFMWDYVGIVRTNKRLQRAQNRVELLKQEVHEFYSHYRVSNDLIELRNLINVAELIIRSALTRRESRGLHFNLDYPDAADRVDDTILFPGSMERLEIMQPQSA